MQIVPLNDIDIRSVPGTWPLSPEIRAAARVHWRDKVAANPKLWDGRILGLWNLAVDADGVLRGEAREDAYSVFLYWRDHDFFDFGHMHLFGAALIASNDGALLFGRMGSDTANAGRIYPPGGSLEPDDVGPDGAVDLLGSIQRELVEETGLSAKDAQVGRVFAVLDGPRIPVVQVFHFAETAEKLAARIHANLETQAHRELADMVVVRSAEEAERAGALPYAVELTRAFMSGQLG